MRTRRSTIIAICLIVFDAIAVAFSYFFGLWLRFDFEFSRIPERYLDAYAITIPFLIVVAVVVFWIFGMYRGIWSLVGFHEFFRYFLVSAIVSVVYDIVITFAVRRMPMSYYIVGTVMMLILVCGARFSYRIYVVLIRRRNKAIKDASAQRIMIIGGGSAGRDVIKELHMTDKAALVPCCIIDDNRNKWGSSLEGVPIVGGRDSIPENVEKYHVDQIYFCIPTASAQTKKEILDICKKTGCGMKSLPGIYQLANEEVYVSDMKPVAIEDLLGREPVKVDLDEIFREIKGKTILVTGGGGSIGSELCRQIADHEPGHLIIFDIYENTTYAIQLELKEKHPDLKLTVLIGSVRDSRKLDQIFSTYHPDIVYHAAAHKHVPLMEDSPNEAIKNNVIGTYKTAYAALKYGTQRFVLISTDKAVNPTSIMGASKRLCEMVIQSMDAVSKSGKIGLLPLVHSHRDAETDEPCSIDPADQVEAELLIEEKPELKVESVKNKNRTGTQFVSVRFGNVLGSNGSVIPVFQRQIEEGGPVTVTDPEITRFFMTIPEAVSLVLQAGTYAWGGEIFVLDMGEPIKIDDLARNLIELSGFEPDVDIKIEYTGLRPGEKLYEEKLMAEEGIQKTENELIYIGKPIPFDVEEFLKQLEELAYASYENSDRIVEMVEQIVTTFHPTGKNQEKSQQN